MTRICVLDYGVGNLRSVANAVTAAGGEAMISGDSAVAAAADGIIVPGVGAFPHVREQLMASGLDKVVLAAVSEGKPVLGICVGMQLLFERGLEFEDVPGMGLIPGIVERIAPLGSQERLPHIAWARPQIMAEVAGDMFAGSSALDRRFYFLHSYTARRVPLEFVAATADYEGYPIVAAVRNGMLWGTQFHPEKSGQAGLLFLRNFIAACEAASEAVSDAAI